MEVSVFLKEQDHLASPASHATSRKWMKLALGCPYVRRIGQNAIQIVNQMSWQEIKQYIRCGERPRVIKPYQGKMPPREMPGVFFQEPQSPTWRLQHRTVRFG